MRARLKVHGLNLNASIFVFFGDEFSFLLAQSSSGITFIKSFHRIFWLFFKLWMKHFHEGTDRSVGWCIRLFGWNTDFIVLFRVSKSKNPLILSSGVKPRTLPSLLWVLTLSFFITRIRAGYSRVYGQSGCTHYLGLVFKGLQIFSRLLVQVVKIIVNFFLN